MLGSVSGGEVVTGSPVALGLWAGTLGPMEMFVE